MYILVWVQCAQILTPRKIIRAWAISWREGSGGGGWGGWGGGGGGGRGYPSRRASWQLLWSVLIVFLVTLSGLTQGRDVHVYFQHCNAHFLLGMSSACEKAITKVGKELESERQQKLGRDQNAKFERVQ